MSKLAARVVVVTGATGTIGRAIAQAYAREGAITVLAARGAAALESLTVAIRRSGGTARPLRADVTVESDVSRLFSQTLAEYGRIDILVNCAGVISLGATHEVSLQQWRGVLDVNTTAAFLCSREVFGIMQRQGGGRIINIGSISAITPRPESVAYTTSKFALQGLTRSLALDGRPFGITASIVHPGLTTADAGAAAMDRIDAADVAEVVVLMASLPPRTNLFEATLLAVHQPSFIGRG